MSTTLDYRIGDTWERVFQWRNNGVPVDLSAVQAVFEVAPSIGSPAVLSLPATVAEADGDVFVSLSAAQTAALTAGHYMARVRLTYPGGIVRSTGWVILRAKRGRE